MSEGAPGRGRDRVVDVLIVGAGPAGAATALALRARGVPRVLLLHKRSHAPFAIGESAAPDVAPLLARLGLGPPPAAHGHIPCHGHLSLWGGVEPVIDDFMRRATGHGWILQRAAFDQWLRDAALAAGAQLEIVDGCRVARRERGFGAHIRKDGREQTLAAGLVVDASGRRAVIARQLGARMRRLDQLVALATLAEPTSPERLGWRPLASWSVVEACPYGWWYAAQLSSGRVSLALMTDHDLARARALRDADGYALALAATSYVGCAVQLTSPGSSAAAVFPAATQHLDRAVGPGWIAVGDALMSFDPLTSAGIVGALNDALAASDTILTWLSAPDAATAMAAASAYRRRAESSMQRYLTERRMWYRREPRWPTEPFWRRRQASLDTESSNTYLHRR